MKKLDQFKGLQVNINFAPIVDEYANRCRSILEQTSPDGKRRNKKYKEGWTTESKGKKGSDTYGVVVWNKTNYQLTHLLENGHLIVNKKGGVGWASPSPHIKPAFDRVRTPFVNAMAGADIHIEVK